MTKAALDPLAAAGAILMAIFAAALSTVVFGRIPHVQDSIAQLFQARILAHGRLWMPSPPLREFFDYAHVINDGRWYSQYPPGHSLLLVPGVWMGVPWLVNPILGGASVVATFLLARRVFGLGAARWAVLLALLSPFFVMMASEFMAHVSGLFAVTWFLYFTLRALESRRARDAQIAGTFLLLAVLVRPYTAFACALPVFFHAAWWYVAARRHGGSRPGTAPPVRAFLWMGAGGLAGVLLYGLYNWGTTGDPFTPGYIRLYGPSHGLGFGKGSWGTPHTLAKGLAHAGENLKALNRDLLAWPLTSLWPLLLGVLPAGVFGKGPAAPAERRAGSSTSRGPGNARKLPDAQGMSRGVPDAPGTSQDGPGPVPGLRTLLAMVPVSLLVLHVFYWYHDLCFGPRYLYESLGAMLAISGLGLARASAVLARLLRWEGRGWRSFAPIALVLVALSVYAGVVGWPRLFRTPSAAVGAAPATGLRMASYFQHYGREFWGVSPQLGETVKKQVSDRALVFVRWREPEPNNPQVRHLWFGSAFAHLDPDLVGTRILYAKDKGAENARLAALFPDRVPYLYTGTIEGGTITRWRPGS